MASRAAKPKQPIISLIFFTVAILLTHTVNAKLTTLLSGKWLGTVEIFDGQNKITGEAMVGFNRWLEEDDNPNLDVVYSNLSNGEKKYRQYAPFRYSGNAIDPFAHVYYPYVNHFSSSCAGTFHFKMMKTGETPFLYGYFESDNPIFKNEHQYIKAILFRSDYVKSLKGNPFPDVSGLIDDNSTSTTISKTSSKINTKAAGNISSQEFNMDTKQGREKKPEYAFEDFKISAKYVTLPTDKKFRWYDWKVAPEELKKATNSILTNSGTLGNREYLRSEIENTIAGGDCDVRIAAIDLNFDGIAGIAIFEEGQICCGTLGCGFELWENGGEMTVELSIDHDVTPARNGVTSSVRKYFPLKGNTHMAGNDIPLLRSKFKYDKVNALPETKIDAKLLARGAATPDELGRKIVTALQTNDRKLWKSCLLPDNEENQQQNEYAFDRFRSVLAERGLADWNKAVFSRITFGLRNEIDQIDKQTGEQIRTMFTVEFIYKNEYIGKIGYMTISTLGHKKWFIKASGLLAGMNRK